MVRGEARDRRYKARDQETAMHARVVRFTDVTSEKISEILARIEEARLTTPGGGLGGSRVLRR